MSYLHQLIKEVNDQAELLEHSDNFAIDAKELSRQVEELRQELFRYVDDPRILDMVEEAPTFHLSAHEPSFLERLLPESTRSMVGNYQNKQKLIENARKIAKAFNHIGRYLPSQGDGFV